MADLDRAQFNLSGAVYTWAQDHRDRTVWLTECAARHQRGDWGDLDPADRALNNQAARNNTGRLLSAYPIPAHFNRHGDDRHLWIITDDLDQPPTTTTMLWPSDY